MRGMDFIGIVLLFFLSLWGALYLEAAMGPYFLFELFVILLLIIVSIGILYAILSNKKWAWHTATAFFASPGPICSAASIPVMPD